MQRSYVRDGLMLAVAAAVGWWAHGERRVEAAPASTSAMYQFTGVGPGTSLTIYNQEERVLYVYQGATMGNSHVSCSFRYHIQRIGDAIDRENCAPGSLTR